MLDVTGRRPVETSPERPRTSTGVLRAVGFLSFFDRLATTPLLLLAVRDLHVSMAAAVQLVTAYALLYAVGQPLWGVLSDRIGRRTVLLVALAGMVGGSSVSVLATSFGGLLVARSLTGLFVGALFPAVLTIVGDHYSGAERSRQISDLQTFTALGTTAATLVAGAIASAAGWQAVFGLNGVGALVLLVLVVRLVDVGERPRVARGLRQSLTRWPLALYAVGALEGALLFGVLTYILPALERDGVGVDLAGLLGSAYGLGVVGGAITSKRVGPRLGRTGSIAVGSGVLVAAYLLASLCQAPPALTVVATLLGLSNAFLHSTLQGLATELTPTSRATTVSFFVCAVFVGSSLATALTGVQTARGYALVFEEATAAGVLLTVAATVLARGWSGHRNHPQPQ